MKNIIAVLFFLAVFIVGYRVSFLPASEIKELSSRTPDSAQLSPDLLSTVTSFAALIENPQSFNVQNCATIMSETYADLSQVRPDYFDEQQVHKDYLQIIRKLYLTRLSLRDRLNEFVQNKQLDPQAAQEHLCVSHMRDVVRAVRFIEDYLGELYLGAKTFDPEKDVKAYGTFTGQEPWLEKSPGVSEITFRSGDIIISRGNAFTSAAIARIGEIDSQFSHLAFVYVDGDDSGREYTLEEAQKNPNVMIMEAHIEIGSTIRSLAEYLSDGNARNVLYRYKGDPKVAHVSAKWSYDYIRSMVASRYKRRSATEFFLDKNHPDFHVPYDFKMDLSSPKEIFCSEIASMGYEKNSIKIPLFFTTLVSRKENSMIDALDISVRKMFAPGDMEFDVRFHMLAEWRDYRKVKNLRFKDAVLSTMFSWMKEKKYEFYRNPLHIIGAKGFFLARNLDIPKVVFNGKVILDLTQTLPKNMTPKTASTVQTLNAIGETLENRLIQAEKEYSKDHNHLLMTHAQFLSVLEQYRKEDAELYQSGKKSDFHKNFRPKDLKKK